MSIEVKNITKIYGKQKALNDVSFKINTGEIVGFLGPNGAGKSTMMKIITGFIPPTHGEVFVNDLDVVENSIEVRQMIGYLPENNPLYHEMYVREYLKYVAGIYKLGKQSKTKIDDIIEITGLTVEQKKKIGELSKGYRQRVGLAQALIHDPKVLILDEPTSGLDPNQIIEIRNLITEIGKEKTVMLSTHIMQEVEAICDRTIIIKQGQIVADDSTKNIHTHTFDKYQTIIVEFDKKFDAQQLLKIDGVIEVKKLDETNCLVQTTEDIDVRPKIFDFAVANKFTVLSMQKKERRLEDVFHELTK